MKYDEYKLAKGGYFWQKKWVIKTVMWLLNFKIYPLAWLGECLIKVFGIPRYH